MLIGNTEVNIRDRVRCISCKSVLHYHYGMTGDESSDMSGITGVIVGHSTYDQYAVAEMKVDEPNHFKNGMTRLFCDDEIEIIK